MKEHLKELRKGNTRVSGGDPITRGEVENAET